MIFSRSDMGMSFSTKIYISISDDLSLVLAEDEPPIAIALTC